MAATRHEFLSPAADAWLGELQRLVRGSRVAPTLVRFTYGDVVGECEVEPKGAGGALKLRVALAGEPGRGVESRDATGSVGFRAATGTDLRLLGSGFIRRLPSIDPALSARLLADCARSDDAFIARLLADPRATAHLSRALDLVDTSAWLTLLPGAGTLSVMLPMVVYPSSEPRPAQPIAELLAALASLASVIVPRTGPLPPGAPVPDAKRQTPRSEHLLAALVALPVLGVFANLVLLLGLFDGDLPLLLEPEAWISHRLGWVSLALTCVYPLLFVPGVRRAGGAAGRAVIALLGGFVFSFTSYLAVASANCLLDPSEPERIAVEERSRREKTGKHGSRTGSCALLLSARSWGELPFDDDALRQLEHRCSALPPRVTELRGKRGLFGAPHATRLR